MVPQIATSEAARRVASTLDVHLIQVRRTRTKRDDKLARQLHRRDAANVALATCKQIYLFEPSRTKVVVL
jgi:hypothetical protein